MKTALSSIAFLWITSFANCSRILHPLSDAPIEQRSLEEQYLAAQKETGNLTILWGGDAQSQASAVIPLWEQQFPKVKLNLVVDLSKYHDSRADRSYQVTGSEQADVAVLQTLHDFERWKHQGRLLPYKPATWESIYSDLKDPDGAFVGVTFVEFGNMIYHNMRLDQSAVPVTFKDFVNPFWKDKLVLTYPNDDDAVLFLFSLIVSQYGWSWFESLLKQDVHWVRGAATPTALIAQANSSAVLSFTSNLSGAPTLSSRATTDGHVIWPQTAGIFASSKYPESAKLFISWMMSDAFQKIILQEAGTPPVRSGLLPNSTSGTAWDDRSVAPSHFGKFMVNRETVEWWRLQFESFLGTAQGASPLTYGI
ncbi:ABC transporter substrate binding protein-like protein [Leptodontidium sp. 2 PMI_412]|nr:ABC transporter substrate binding protein-like protein [Leptodontidium sp. 2 PMI_412]